MIKCVFSIGSVTHAMKAQKALNQAAVPSKVVKTKSEQRGRGCLYGVEIDCMYRNVAMQILSSYGISYDITTA